MEICLSFAVTIVNKLCIHDLVPASGLEQEGRSVRLFDQSTRARRNGGRHILVRWTPPEGTGLVARSWRELSFVKVSEKSGKWIWGLTCLELTNLMGFEEPSLNSTTCCFCIFR